MVLELRQLVITSVLIGLFTISLISFGVNLASDNNVNNTLLEDKIINETFGNLRTQLASDEETTDALRTGQQQSIPSDGSDETPILSATKSSTSWWSVTKATPNLVFGLVERTFGLNEGTGRFVFVAMVIILTATIVILFYGWLKSGR